jgi:hypothetical protein
VNVKRVHGSSTLYTLFSIYSTRTSSEQTIDTLSTLRITKKQRTRQLHRRDNWQAPAKPQSIQRNRNWPQAIEAFQTTAMCVNRTQNRMCANCEDVVVSTDHKIVQCGQFDRRNETHRRRGHCGTLEVWTLAYQSPRKCDGCQDMKGGLRRREYGVTDGGHGNDGLLFSI